MTDSTIGILIEEKDNPVISVRDLVGGGYYQRSHADIGIDMRNLHFSLTLPKKTLKELMEKAQEFLGKNEPEIQERTESDEIPIHVEG